MPEPEVDKEATRLGEDPRLQKAASEPLDPVGVSGPVEVKVVDEREYQQHPGVGVAGPEKLLLELPELAAPREVAEQRPATVLHGDQGQHRDGGQHTGRLHTGDLLSDPPAGSGGPTVSTISMMPPTPAWSELPRTPSGRSSQNK